MAETTDTSTRPERQKRMHPAHPAAIKNPVQTVRGGYQLSEEAEYKLRTIVDAMRGIAVLVEGTDDNRGMPEIPAEEMAAIFRMIGEATDNIRNAASLICSEVQVRPRRTVN